jgi:hypothetical protein
MMVTRMTPEVFRAFMQMGKDRSSWDNLPPTRNQLKQQARATAKFIIKWLDALDPRLLEDADRFGEELVIRGSRLYKWAEKQRPR